MKILKFNKNSKFVKKYNFSNSVSLNLINEDFSNSNLNILEYKIEFALFKFLKNLFQIFFKNLINF